MKRIISAKFKFHINIDKISCEYDWAHKHFHKIYEANLQAGGCKF